MMSDTEFFAMLCEKHIETDRAATFETRTIFTSNTIQHLIEQTGLTFAPGLADIIRAPHPPSVEQLRACSLSTLSKHDLQSKWIVYLQFLVKGPVWFIYCGKSTNLKGGQSRLDDYEKERELSETVMDLLSKGFERRSHTIIAAVDIPFEGPDRIYTAALITMFEGTFTAGFWAYHRPTLGSITPLRFWEEMPWFGLCTHSSLMEITFEDLKDDMPNLDEILLDRKERARLANQKFRSTEKGQAALDNYNNSLKTAYRTDEEFRNKRLQYSKQYTADGKAAIVKAKHKTTEKYKITEAAYKASGALAEAKSRYATSDKNKVAQAKYAATKNGKAAAQKKQDKYRTTDKYRANCERRNERRREVAKAKKAAML